MPFTGFIGLRELNGYLKSYKLPNEKEDRGGGKRIGGSAARRFGGGETYRRVGGSAFRWWGETYRWVGGSAFRWSGETYRRVGGSAFRWWGKRIGGSAARRSVRARRSAGRRLAFGRETYRRVGGSAGGRIGLGRDMREFGVKAR